MDSAQTSKSFKKEEIANGIMKVQKMIQKLPRSKPVEKKPKDEKYIKKKRENQLKPKNDVVDHQANDSTFYKAKKLYEVKEKSNQNKMMNKGDKILMKKIMDSGTLADKISAYAIKIRDNPEISIDPLVGLLGLARDQNRRKKLLAIGTLKELFLEKLLPKKKLNQFSTCLKGIQNPTETQLIDAYYEHRIRELYMVYLQIIEKGLNDELDFFKDNLTAILGELLAKKPEREDYILSMLINKFGDKSKKYITGLNKVLSGLLFRHKSMCSIVAKEIENFIYRPNISHDAIFYALHFLCSLDFEQYVNYYFDVNFKDSSILVYLAKVFFKFFFENADKKETDNEKIHKIQSVLLKAINKLYPKIYEMVNKYNSLEFKDPKSRSMLDEHIDQLFRMSHQCPFKIRVQALILLFQFLKLSSELNDRFYRVLYELLFVDDIIVNSANQQFLDLLFNAVKEDYSMTRVKAFLKRLLQVSIHAEPPFVIATLLLVHKILEIHPGARSLLNYSQNKTLLEDDEEENFQDAPDEDEEVKQETKKDKKSKEGNEKEVKKSFSKEYDPLKREPLYSNADNTLMYELLLLSNHYHPTVKKYAEGIINNEKGSLFDYKGNPLIDYSLSNFLDRISFKKPKKAFGNKQNKMRMSKLSAPISETFTSGENIREDEEYFVRYFNNKTPRTKNKKAGDADDEEEEMDAFADELFEKQLKEDNFGDDDLDAEADIFGDEELDGYDDEEGDDFEDDDEYNEGEFGDILENIGEGEDDDEIPEMDEEFDDEDDD